MGFDKCCFFCGFYFSIVFSCTFSLYRFHTGLLPYYIRTVLNAHSF